jgi:XTP/dITP diphosphohydrolase
MKQIVLASTNEGKLREFKSIFSRLEIEVVPQSAYNVPDIDEPYITFMENALHKARHCSRHTGLPALADDSGICVKSLNGSPGIYSARYAGEPRNAKHNNQKLVEELSKFTDKSAYFYCVLVLVRHELDPQPLFADGIIDGVIVDHPRGNAGHGYDPHFYVQQFDKTMAELDSDIKNQISHRALAVESLLAKLKYSNV